jgi:uncharacterized membrane protein (DUF485 family)
VCYCSSKKHVSTTRIFIIFLFHVNLFILSILTTPCKVLLDSFIHPDPKILTTWLILAVVILIAAIIIYTVYKCFDNERKPYMKNNNAEQATFLEKNCLSA